MTEPCHIAARLKNDKIISIYSEHPDLFALCFEEEDFLKMLNESEMLINKQKFDIKSHIPRPIEPSGIGIIFYDYKNKYAFSCQDYFNVLDFPLYRLFFDPLLMLYDFSEDRENFMNVHEYIFGKKTEEIKKNIIKNLRGDLSYLAMLKGVSEDYIDSINSYSELDYLLYEDDSQRVKYQAFNKIKREGCFRNKWNNEIFPINGSNVFEDLCYLKKTEDSFRVSGKIKSLYSLDIEYPGWKLIHDYKNVTANLNLLKNYLDKENLLNESSKLEWDKFISDLEQEEE